MTEAANLAASLSNSGMGRYQYKREPLSAEEANRLANACATHLERLVVYTFLDTGVRVSEIASLKRSQLDWQNHRVTIYGKGGPVREPPEATRLAAESPGAGAPRICVAGGMIDRSYLATMHDVGWNRLQFGFTISYHYLFPQLTMGLALLLVVFKAMGLWRGDERSNDLARFWGRVFGINFALGVVTGIPMEFQFGTNWARFSAYAGGVVGLTLALEGMFAFFAESAFLGLFLFGERRLGPLGHLLSAVMVFVGSWLSGYFIVATNAFMQHPTGYAVGGDGTLQLADLRAYLLNGWAFWQYAHTMCAAVVTGSLAVAAVGAYWALMRQYEGHARRSLEVGVIAGLIASGLLLFPTGDANGKLVARYQVPTLAAMEGKFESSARADLAIVGQPDVAHRTLVNPVYVPRVLSYLAYGSFGATVVGLNDVPQDEWPDNIELLYYAYHIMVGLGMIFMAVMFLAAVQLWRGRLAESRPMLWALLLAFPFPYIATTAGWLVAELGRQPWLVYGLHRTRDGTSPSVPTGNVVFTLLGFMGLYLLIGLLFLYLILRELARGPEAVPEPAH